MITTSDSAPGADQDARAWAQQVLSALERLDGTEIAVVRLVYFHGLTQQQAAARLGLPVAAVRTSMASALQRLAERLS